MDSSRAINPRHASLLDAIISRHGNGRVRVKSSRKKSRPRVVRDRSSSMDIQKRFLGVPHLPSAVPPGLSHRVASDSGLLKKSVLSRKQRQRQRSARKLNNNKDAPPQHPILTAVPSLDRAASDPLSTSRAAPVAATPASSAAALTGAVHTTLAAASRTADLYEALSQHGHAAPVLHRSVSDPRDPMWPVDPAAWDPSTATVPGAAGKAPRLLFPPWTPQRHTSSSGGGFIKKLLKHYSVSCSIREDGALKAALRHGPPYIHCTVTPGEAAQALQSDHIIDTMPVLFGWCQHTFSLEVASEAPDLPAAAAAGGSTRHSHVGHLPSPMDFTRHAGNVQRLHSVLLAEGQSGGGAGSILVDDNAGGASENSESLSAELLDKCYSTPLCRSETSVPYDDPHSSIVDYVARWSGAHRVGVSVTRAMKFVHDRPDPYAFTPADAVHLLTKKLRGLRSASHSVNMHHSWSRRVLHIWADTSIVAGILKRELQRSVLTGIASGVLTEASVARIVEQEDVDNMFSLYCKDDHDTSSSGASTPSLGWLEQLQPAASTTGEACRTAHVSTADPAGRVAAPPIVPPELLVDAFVMVTVCEPRSLMYGIIFENKQQWAPACMPAPQAAAAAVKAEAAARRHQATSAKRARGRGRGRKAKKAEEQAPRRNKYHVDLSDGM